MRAGLLNKEVTFLKPEVTKNEVGEIEEYYNPHFTTKARLQHTTSTRDIENTEVLFNTVDIFTVRDYHKFTLDYRIECLGKVYRIIRILEEPEYRQITIHAEIVNE